MRQANRNDIPEGRENAISRQALARRWNCSEREARRMIAELRAEAGGDNHAILSTSHQPSGYWRSSDPDEIRAFIAETEARARNTFVSIAGAKYVLRQLEAATAYPRRLDQRGEV